MTEDMIQLRKTLQRLTAVRAALLSDYPFFGRLLLHLSLGLADCGTACTDMRRVLFDPRFTDRLSDEELRFVFLHEILHTVLRHCLRGKTLDPYVYNIAADIVVNSTILETMGDPLFTVAGEIPMHLAPDGKEGREYTAEDVYRLLMRQGNPKDRPASVAPAGTDGPSAGMESGSSAAGASFPGDEPHGAGIDSHDIWREISCADAQKLDDVWEKRIRSAAKTAGIDSCVPTAIRRHLAETALTPRTNWRQALAAFIRHDSADYTFLQRDRRYSGAIVIPSFVEDLHGENAEGLWFCIDTSGSVSDERLRELYDEIRSACRQLDRLSGKVAFFDTKMTELYPFENEDDFSLLRPVGGGGTSFRCIFRRLAECGEEELPTGIVILTDGYAAFPDESSASGVPVLWIIIEDGPEPDWGSVIHLYD